MQKMKSQRAVISCLLGVVFLGLVAADSDGQTTFSQLEVSAYADYVRLLDFFAGQMEQITSEEQFEYIRHRVAENVTDKNLLGFSFKNCDKPKKEQVVPSNVNLSPDPLKLPGNVTASGSVEIKKKVTSPVKTALEVYKKVLGFWIKVPCIDHQGSCTYDDVCSMIKIKNCPAPLVKAGLGCKCPFPAGKYTLKPFSLYVKAKSPVSGGLKIKAVATQGKQLITCVEIEVNLA